MKSLVVVFALAGLLVGCSAKTTPPSSVTAAIVTEVRECLPPTRLGAPCTSVGWKMQNLTGTVFVISNGTCARAASVGQTFPSSCMNEPSAAGKPPPSPPQEGMALTTPIVLIIGLGVALMAPLLWLGFMQYRHPEKHRALVARTQKWADSKSAKIATDAAYKINGKAWWLAEQSTLFVEYASISDLNRDLPFALEHGWEVDQASSSGSHVNIGRTTTGAVLTGGLSLLFGGSRSGTGTTVTWKRTLPPDR